MKLEIHNEDYSIVLKLKKVSPDEFTMEYTCLRIRESKRGRIFTDDGADEYFNNLYFDYVNVRSVSIQELRGHDYSWINGLGEVEYFILYLPGTDNDKPRSITRTFHGKDHLSRKILEIFIKHNTLSKIKLL